MSISKRSNSMKKLVKKVKEFAYFKSQNPYRDLSAELVQMEKLDKKEKLERKRSSTRWRNQAVRGGCLAVYVGEERRRFVIPTEYLSHPVFSMLLDKAREEYGFKQQEGLTVPCDVEAFEQSLWLIERSRTASGQFDLETLVNKLVINTTIVPRE